MPTTAYTFNSCGYYIGKIAVQESPLEEGKYLIPSNATIIPPPAVVPGIRLKWNGKSWEQVSIL